MRAVWTNLSKYLSKHCADLGLQRQSPFRALKTKGNIRRNFIAITAAQGPTSFYRMVMVPFDFIGVPCSSTRGRISRFLPNKCSIASRNRLFLGCVGSLLSAKQSLTWMHQTPLLPKFGEACETKSKKGGSHSSRYACALHSFRGLT